MANELKMPQLGLTMEEGTITEWLKTEGDEVQVGEAVAEITTDKITTEIVSEFSGTLLKIVVPEGETVEVKSTLAYIGSTGEQLPCASGSPVAEAPVSTPEPVAASAKPASGAKRIRISPLARKTAEKLGIDYSGIAGSGPAGRIVQKDILDASAAAKAPAKAQSAHAEEAPAKKKLSGMRKVVAERMLASHTQIPSVTQTVKVDVTELLELRAKLKASGAKITINDLVLKATAIALKDNPHMLVSYDDGCIIEHKHINIGMAVALDNGLIVPVIRDADKLSLSELASKASELASKAKNGTLSMDDYSGSTFSVSNLGMFGVESFTPIINQPNAAILGVCATEKELALDSEGGLIQRSVMRLSLTYDHRLMDGAVAARFELAIKELLEAPIKILL